MRSQSAPSREHDRRAAALELGLSLRAAVARARSRVAARLRIGLGSEARRRAVGRLRTFTTKFRPSLPSQPSAHLLDSAVTVQSTPLAHSEVAKRAA